MMKTIAKIAIIGMALAFVACDVDRTGENSVEISTDTAATAEAARETETALDATETALREGAQKTGTAIEEAGKEIQEHSKPGNQP
jgi:hypothetical protein